MFVRIYEEGKSEEMFVWIYEVGKSGGKNRYSAVLEDIPGRDEGQHGGKDRYGDGLEDTLVSDEEQNARILNSENKKRE